MYCNSIFFNSYDFKYKTKLVEESYDYKGIQNNFYHAID